MEKIAPQKNHKRILILSMTGGFGHIMAGAALLDYAKENRKDVHAEHVDVLDITSSFFRKFSSKFYEAISKDFPFIWGIFYKALDSKITSFLAKKLMGFNFLFVGKIRKYIKEKNPDGIIFTNIVLMPFFAPVCRKVLPNANFGVVVTDYHGHPYYNLPYINHYFVANEKVGQDLEKNGVKKEKIVVTGIPINPRFYIKQNIDELKEKYKIKNSLPVVLLIVSFRISEKELLSSVKSLIELSAPKINLIVITNGNKEFYQALENNFSGNKRIILVNWTNMMEEYMKISDVVISKAGGLTVTECLSLNRKMIIVNPIPGQEEHNADFLEKNNFGIKIKKINEVISVLPKIIELAQNGIKKDMAVPQENPSEKIFKYF